MVADPVDAADALPGGARAFLAIGRKDLGVFAGRGDVWFAARVIDPPSTPFPLVQGRFVVGRPPFSIDDEIALLRRLAITHLVARNAGGDAGHAKLDAATVLGVEVVMIERPSPVSGATVFAEEDVVCDWLESLVARRR